MKDSQSLAECALKKGDTIMVMIAKAPSNSPNLSELQDVNYEAELTLMNPEFAIEDPEGFEVLLSQEITDDPICIRRWELHKSYVFEMRTTKNFAERIFRREEAFLKLNPEVKRDPLLFIG